MQTFLPYPDFAASARSLDNRRLGKQRVEAWQILRALSGETKGWRNHPATRMWAGYEPALALYGLAMCYEWRRRGFKDTLSPRFGHAITSTPLMPPWLGNPAFHAAHRAALLAKDPEHYGQHGWTEAAAVAYVWPA